jgi:hypothetical protein
VRRITGELASIAAAAWVRPPQCCITPDALRRATGQRKAQLHRAINHLHALMGRTHVPAQGLLRSEPLTWADHARAEPRVGAFRRIPRHQWERVRAWEATFYNALAQENCSAASTWRKCGYPRVVSTSTCAWALGSPSTAGVCGTCSTSAASSGQTLKIFGHGGSGGSFAFVDLEHRIGYSYVMNKFDATMAHADPRCIALSDEVFAALGQREFIGLAGG